MKTMIRVNPNIELFDPITGQVRDKNTGQVFHLSSEALKLVALFIEPQEVDIGMELIGNLIETDDIETLKMFFKNLIQQGILIDSSKNKISVKSQIQVSDIALVEKPVSSCLSLPVAGLECEYPYQYALIGMPFDLGSTGYPGARFGPIRLRELSANEIDYRASLKDMSCEGWAVEHDLRLCSGMKIVDVGDVIHQIGEPFSAFFDRAENAMNMVRERGSIPIVIGGDHSCLYPEICSSTKNIDDPIHLIVFDAHTDLANYDDLISHNHGNVISRILSEGLVETLTQIGLRGMVGKTIDRGGYNPIYCNQCIDIDSVLRLINFTEGEKIYISFDVDSIDPTFAPGTGTPIPFGLNPQLVLSCIQSLIERGNVVGVDIVEYNPMRDVFDMTGNMLLYMLPRILDAFKKY